jgi:hypothetical protein
MTLAEWKNDNPTALVVSDDGPDGSATYALVRNLPADRVTELWHLDDYTVYSQTGMTIWLFPKPKP